MNHSTLGDPYFAPFEVWLLSATIFIPAAAWVILMAYTFSRLKNKHPLAWEEFGRPEIPSPNLARFLSALLYLATPRHKALNDRRLSRCVVVARVLFVLLHLNGAICVKLLEPYAEEYRRADVEVTNAHAIGP